MIKSSDRKTKALYDTISILQKKVTRLEEQQQRPDTSKTIHDDKDDKKEDETKAKLKPKPSELKQNPSSVSSNFKPTPPSPKPTPIVSNLSRAESSSTTSKLKSKFLSKPKILYIADSVGHTAAMSEVERTQNCRVRTARAYGSVPDTNARWPDCNFTDVARYELENHGREHIDVMILSAPTSDITNLDTSQLRPNDNTDALQQQVILSSQNMMHLAETSLRNNTKLVKVVLMEHHPRFDTTHTDPTSLKPTLARLANFTLNQLWLNSPLKHKIVIGRHSLESSGLGMAHLQRYQDQNTGRYDGVHLYGKTGRSDYTNSLKTIFLVALSELSPSQDNWRGLSQSEEHKTCPQAMYQKYQKVQYKKAQYQRAQSHFSIPTRNRFSALHQGNF